ncbi:general stress protein [Nostoc sp. TCL26-01]|uniref:general stress protein n=1 Tax=Nostoc sp. TCL26-01 TaxID=2576904 RepID=UPI0015BEB6F2|nr:general stress protein [Nostoc sp. TCL26-01]QLE56321.1 histidine kinase [Nostoc sp. TCL26-01]
MVVGVGRRAVGVFSHRRDAEQALHELKQSGFAMDRVSVIAQDTDRNEEIAGTPVQERVGDKSDEGAKVGAATGGALGGLGGLLVGLGILAIPGIGPIMLAGATATTLATTLAGAGIGAVAGSLLGGLIGLGIPEERARAYEDRVRRGHYLVIVDGTDAEIAQAEAILRRRGIEDYDVYDSPRGTGTTDIGRTKHAVGYFSLLPDAEAAINDLRHAGFPLSQISLIHRAALRSNAFTDIDVSDRFDSHRWRLPEQRTRFYNERINHGDYIVAVSGTDADIQRAAGILSRHGIQQWQIFDPTDDSATYSQGNRRAIGAFPHRRDAEAALGELRDAGFPMNRVSLIAKDASGTPGVGGNLGQGNKADEGAKAGAATGGALGGLGGLLVGLGTLAIPGVGPVIAGGAISTALATTLAGGAIGAAAGGIVGGLAGLGIPENRARVYNDRFQRGEYLVIVDGTEAEIQHAETILKRRGIQEYSVFDARDLHEGTRPVVDHRRQEDIVHPVTGDRSEPIVEIIDHREGRV